MSGAWTNALEARDMLVGDGWRCPDSYAKHFSPVTNESAVYLFLLYRVDDFTRAIFAYVGMTTDLESRMAGHEIIQQIGRQNYWTCRWFKPTPVDDLRTVERFYIEKFNPPWNIIGRIRGVDLP